MATALTRKEQQLKKKFIEGRGYWSDHWIPVLKNDPDFFEAYLNFSSAPRKRGALSPKMIELIYVAVDAAATHLYQPGIRIHMRNAIKYGATREEIMEVLECVSAIGIHTMTVGLPILLEEMQQAKEPR